MDNSFGQRLNMALKHKGLTAYKLSKELDLQQSTISNYKNDKTTPTSSTIKSIASILEVNYEWLLSGSGEMNMKNNNFRIDDAAIEVPTNYIKVPVIPIKAQAGLLSGYGDTAYWDGLPTEIWEVDREYKGNYVVFEIRGDSMDDNTVEAILEGDRVLCREIGKQHWQNKLHINKWNFVIVHKEEGIIVKRITEHNVENGTIMCHSLNSYYEDFEINLADVIALYNVVDLKRNLRL